MENWQVEFSREAFKQYNKLPVTLKNRIDRIIERLIVKEKLDLKPVKGEENIYRLRVGKFRMLFKMITGDNVLLIVRIKSRGDVYKNL